MSVGNNLKQLRLKCNISQKELATILGISRPMISQLERGTKSLSLNLANEITKVLKCKLEDFVKN